MRRAKPIKVLYWGTVLLFYIMPLNFTILMSIKPLLDIPFEAMDLVLLAVAAVGAFLGTRIYRQYIAEPGKG